MTKLTVRKNDRKVTFVTKKKRNGDNKAEKQKINQYK
jgi:hypothetical protein